MADLNDIELAETRPPSEPASKTDAPLSKPHESFGDVLRDGFAEFLATFLFLFITISTVVFSGFGSDSNGSMTTGRHLIVALVFGISIVVLVYQFAGLSGANINPAVTTSLMATRRISVLRGLVYIVSQCVGAVLGTLVVKALDSAVYEAAGGGCNSVPPTTKFANNYGASFGVEFMGTALLIFTVFAAIDPKQGDSIVHIKGLGPLAIGLAVFLAHLIAIQVTGTSINPARSFGPAVVNNCWSDHWMFWVAPICGALIAAFTYDFLLVKDWRSSLARLKGE